MTITDIKVRKLISDGRLRAIISITLDDILAIHDIKVVEGDGRLFVAMPSRKDENGLFRDIVHSISSDVRDVIEKMIIKEYQKIVSQKKIEEESGLYV